MNELAPFRASVKVDLQAAIHSLMIGSEYKKRAMPAPRNFGSSRLASLRFDVPHPHVTCAPSLPTIKQHQPY